MYQVNLDAGGRRSIIASRLRPWPVNLGLGLFVTLLILAFLVAVGRVSIPLIVLWGQRMFPDPAVASGLAVFMAKDAFLWALALVIGTSLAVITVHHAQAGRRSGRNAIGILSVFIAIETIVLKNGFFTSLAVCLVAAGILALLWWPRRSRLFFVKRESVVPRRHVLHFWFSLAAFLLVFWPVFEATVSPILRDWVNRPDFSTSARTGAAITGKVSSIDISQLLPSRLDDPHSVAVEIGASLQSEILKQVGSIAATAFSENSLGRLVQLGYLLAFAAVVIGILGTVTELSKGLVRNTMAFRDVEDESSRVRILRWELRDAGWYALCLNRSRTGGVYLVDDSDTREPDTRWVRRESLEPAFPFRVSGAVREVGHAAFYASILLILVGCVAAVVDAAGYISAMSFGLHESLDSPQLDALARSQLQAQIATASSDIARGAVTTTLSVAAVAVALIGLVVAARRRRVPVAQEAVLEWLEPHGREKITAMYAGLVSVDRVKPGRHGWEGLVRASGRIGVRRLGWFPLDQLKSPSAGGTA